MSEQSPEGQVPSGLEGLDPAMVQALLAQIGSVAGPVPGAPMPMSEADVAGLVADTSAAVSGRLGLTGKPFSGILPWWVTENPDLTRLATEAANIWDPYLGFDEQGDERVYMGGRDVKESRKTVEAALAPWAVREYGEGYMPPRKTLNDDGTTTEEWQSFEGDKEWFRTEPTAEERDQALNAGMMINHSTASQGGLAGAPSAQGASERALIEQKMWFWYGPDWKSHLESGTMEETRQRIANPADSTQTLMQVQNLPFTWDEDEVRDAMRRMRAAGHKVTTFDEMVKVWEGMSTRAGMMYSLSEGKRKVTPWDVLDITKREMQDAGNFIDYESGSWTSTRKEVANITEGAAWSTLQQTLSQMLGRDPSDQEVRDFAYRMNQLAAKNPKITETITRFKAGNVAGEDSTSEGGFTGEDLAQEAYEQAQEDPNYAEYQSATTYFNAALSALGEIGSS